MTIFGRTDPCERHRPALADWIEHRADGPMTPSAFDHLARCRRCERELTEIALTVIALRRLGERASLAEVPTDGWHDLRARVESSRSRPRPGRRSRWALVGSMLGPAMVAVLVLRVAVSAAPVGADWTSDGLAGTTISSVSPRPMYDSGPRLLTEGIVRILSGRVQGGDDRSEWPAMVPASTDRRDVTPVVRRTAIRSESTPPRTAFRS
jgi:hypothetical protein